MNDNTDPEEQHTLYESPLLSEAIDRSLEALTDQFAEQFHGIFARETIERYVFESYTALFRSATNKRFLIVFTERFVLDRLTALAQHRGALAYEVPEVLFVCVHNAGRSQLAAALMHYYARGQVHVRSAGSAPAGSINDAVRQAMTEVGLDISQEFPKPLTDDITRAADVLVTMGCGDACPVYPGKRYLDWELDDPAGRPIEEVRQIRDNIDQHVRDLLEDLVPGIDLPPSLATLD